MISKQLWIAFMKMVAQSLLYLIAEIGKGDYIDKRYILEHALDAHDEFVKLLEFQE